MKHCWKNALGSVNRSCLWQEAYSLFYTPVLLEEEKFLIILIFIKIKKLLLNTRQVRRPTSGSAGRGGGGDGLRSGGGSQGESAELRLRMMVAALGVRKHRSGWGSLKQGKRPEGREGGGLSFVVMIQYVMSVNLICLLEGEKYTLIPAVAHSHIPSGFLNCNRVFSFSAACPFPLPPAFHSGGFLKVLESNRKLKGFNICFLLHMPKKL